MRIGIIDDHPLVREGLISILSLHEDFEVVGEATNCQEGIFMIIEKKPEIVIIDLKLGNQCGLDIIREVKNKVECKFVQTVLIIVLIIPFNRTKVKCKYIGKIPYRWISKIPLIELK